MGLTNIANRKTPSAPMEITFGTPPIGTGVKFTTLFGHFAASPGSGTPYQVYTVINVGDAEAAQAEVDALAGSGSQIGQMTLAFVNANAEGENVNFPNFRVVLIPYSETAFGPSAEATNAVSALRSDMLVSCYPAEDTGNLTIIKNLAITLSGIDRDLQGQFGSFATLASLQPLATQLAFNANSQYLEIACFPDSNTAEVPITGTTTSGNNVITAITQPALTPTGVLMSGSAVITAISDTSGIYPGASVTGTGIPSNTTILSVTETTALMSKLASSDESSETITFTNLPTAGIYPGAEVSGTGIPSNATITSVQSNSFIMSQNATGNHSSESITVQNVVSQVSEIVAAAHAGAQMASAFPYNPLQGVTIGGLIPQQILSDRIAFDPSGASEAALDAGLSPLYVQAGNTVGFIRTVTTLTVESDNVTPVTAYYDWQDLVTLNDFREDCFYITQNPPFNGNPGGTKASQTIANLLRDEILREAMSYESQGAFQAVKTLAPQFLVQPSTTSRGRFDFFIPVNVIPGLFVIAGNIQGVTSFDFTL